MLLLNIFFNYSQFKLVKVPTLKDALCSHFCIFQIYGFILKSQVTPDEALYLETGLGADKTLLYLLYYCVNHFVHIIASY